MLEINHITHSTVRANLEGLLELKVYLNNCPYPSTPLQVSIEELKEKKVIQNSNGLNKAEKWFNTTEGKINIYCGKN